VAADAIGAVLAGGHGRRIGGEKALLSLGNRTLVRHAFDALRSAGLEVALVLRRDQPVPLTAHPVAIVRDQIENAGPLGGLQALLRWSPAEWALVVACDQPFVAPELLRALLSEPREHVQAVCADPGSGAEPLPALYHRSSLPLIDRALTGGERSLRELLGSLRLRALPALAVERHDPERLSFVNVNTPAELRRARSLYMSAQRQNGRLHAPAVHPRR
jgi:molybdopterin-guanine dinucleotide biosynthesis protein A